jgi:hypothetical protein
MFEMSVGQPTRTKDKEMKIMTITHNQYEARVAAHEEAVFYLYTDKAEAFDSFCRKDANPRFNSDELFVFEVEGYGFVVQTTGSLVKAGV